MLSPELRARKPQIIEDFHRLYYDSFETTWETTTWMGVKVLKNPHDLWMYQEVIVDTRPQLIVECGTAHGGSALYFADLLDLLGDGHVYTIDIADPSLYPRRVAHPRITYLHADSTDPTVKETVRQRFPDVRTMVILDSNHHVDHVLRELDLWADIVSSGCYLVVEDTNINGRPVVPEHGEGPAEALERWLPHHPEFVADPARERYLLTFNQGGWLLRR